ALEGGVGHRMVLGAHGEPVVGGIEARPPRHRPALQRPLQLQPEIEMEAGGGMLLDHEDQVLAPLRRDAAGGLRRLREVALAIIDGERVLGLGAGHGLNAPPLDGEGSEWGGVRGDAWAFVEDHPHPILPHQGGGLKGPQIRSLVLCHARFLAGAAFFAGAFFAGAAALAFGFSMDCFSAAIRSMTLEPRLAGASSSSVSIFAPFSLRFFSISSLSAST